MFKERKLPGKNTKQSSLTWRYRASLLESVAAVTRSSSRSSRLCGGAAGECLTLESGNGSSVSGGREAECPVVG